jgi:hypothetical protein
VTDPNKGRRVTGEEKQRERETERERDREIARIFIRDGHWGSSI